MDDELSVYEYVKDNFIGLLLLFLAFIIIYVVDHVSQLNNLIFSMPLPIQSNLINLNYTKIKNKKHIK